MNIVYEDDREISISCAEGFREKVKLKTEIYNE